MRRFPVALFVAFVLSACGGGGGGSTTSPSLPSLTPGGAVPNNSGSSALSLPHSYTVVDLGAFVQPAAINNRNTVAGSIQIGNGAGFMYRKGKLIKLSSGAVAINDSDVAVGGNLEFLPDGTEKTLQTVNPAVYVEAQGIDDSGKIYGLAIQGGVAGCNDDFALLSPTAPANVLGGQTTTLVVSHSGKVAVGGYEQSGPGCTGTISPFYYPADTAIPLPSDLTLDINASAIVGVNDAGDAVGYSTQNGTGATVTFFAHHGTATEIAAHSGNVLQAAAINNADWIVGMESYNTTTHAFVWINGTITDLNTHLTAGCAQWVLNTATGVNDSGYIVGVGTLNGAQHGFLLVPSAS